MSSSWPLLELLSVQNILELDIRAKDQVDPLPRPSTFHPRHSTSEEFHLLYTVLHQCFHCMYVFTPFISWSFLQTSRFCGFSCDVHLFANDINCLKIRGFHCGARPYTRGPLASERCVGGIYVECGPKAGPSASMKSDFAPRRKATVRLIYCHRVVRDTVPLFSCHNKTLSCLLVHRSCSSAGPRFAWPVRT